MRGLALFLSEPLPPGLVFVSVFCVMAKGPTRIETGERRVKRPTGGRGGGAPATGHRDGPHALCWAMAHERTRPIARRAELPTVESPAGIFRTTLAYDEKTMLCHFRLTRGARIPMHSHPAVQNGYMISGKMKFLVGESKSFEAVPGTGGVSSPGSPMPRRCWKTAKWWSASPRRGRSTSKGGGEPAARGRTRACESAPA